MSDYVLRLDAKQQSRVAAHIMALPLAEARIATAWLECIAARQSGKLQHHVSIQAESTDQARRVINELEALITGGAS